MVLAFTLQASEMRRNCGSSLRRRSSSGGPDEHVGPDRLEVLQALARVGVGDRADDEVALQVRLVDGAQEAADARVDVGKRGRDDEERGGGLLKARLGVCGSPEKESR
jgi:hypothetical protein